MQKGIIPPPPPKYQPPASLGNLFTGGTGVDSVPTAGLGGVSLLGGDCMDESKSAVKAVPCGAEGSWSDLLRMAAGKWAGTENTETTIDIQTDHVTSPNISASAPAPAPALAHLPTNDRALFTPTGPPASANTAPALPSAPIPLAPSSLLSTVTGHTTPRVPTSSTITSNIPVVTARPPPSQSTTAPRPVANSKAAASSLTKTGKPKRITKKNKTQPPPSLHTSSYNSDPLSPSSFLPLSNSYGFPYEDGCENANSYDCYPLMVSSTTLHTQGQGQGQGLGQGQMPPGLVEYMNDEDNSLLMIARV